MTGGHTAPVLDVEFTNDSQYIISSGGNDCCVFVWKLLAA